MKANWDQIEALFAEALTHQESERLTWLQTACADLDVRREIEEMLATINKPLGIEPRLFAADAPTPPNPLVGTQVGPYTLVELLGHGGMGSVWLAQQSDGVVDRQVAVKLVRQPHTADEARALRRRFEAERRILARLEHPGIVRLLEAGTAAPATGGGESYPYFAMDYVSGESLTSYAEQRRLPIEERLDLFTQVCEAVHHAHQRLVVHRDLKPSNILVTDDENGQAQVKLLDFGIARLLDGEDAGASALTEIGLRPMTRAYAAPEQLRGEPATTATDVYALGVVLHELLTGRRPFDAPTPAHLEEAILTANPSRPSVTLAGSDTSTAGIEPRRIRGDLDAIVLTALRKEPGARYASAEALAADVRRHLNGQPVSARAPSAGYRMRAFVRRHRAGVAAAAVALLVLVGFTVTLAVQQRATARERDTAQATAAFLEDLFGAADPAEARGDTLTALDLLDRGAARIETELAGRPVVRANLLDVMSRAYLGLGAYERAETLARRAVALRIGADPGSAPSSYVRLAAALEAQSQFREADSLHRLVVQHFRERRDTPGVIEALEERGRFLIGSLSPRDSITTVFDEALALRRRHYGAEDPERGRLLLLYASGYHLLGDMERAEHLFLKALREQHHQPDDPAATADALFQLGMFTHIRRDYAVADTLLREATLLRQEIYTRQHPKTAEALQLLGVNLSRQERFEEAEALLRETLQTFERHDGRSSEGYAFGLRNLRMLLSQMGRFEEALAVSREAVASIGALHGTDSRSYATNLGHHAQLLTSAGRAEEAIAVYGRVLPLVRTVHGTENPFYGVVLGERARAADSLGRVSEAVAYYEQAYEVLIEYLEPDSYERSRVALALGRHRAARGDHREAILLFEDAASVRVADTRAAAHVAARARHGLGASLLALGRVEQAEPHLRASFSALNDVLGADHRETRAARVDLDACRRALRSG